MKDIKEIKVFLASPGDVKSEREECKRQIERINRVQGKKEHFVLKLLRWEELRSSFGQYAQGEVNKQIGTDYDIFIGIMWTRFGAPTQNADSGTEEEFNLAYDRLKNGEKVRIMFYFSKAALDPDNIDPDQWKKVKEFKGKLGDEYGGLYKEYSSKDEFGDLIHDHLQETVYEILDDANLPNIATALDIDEGNNKDFNERFLQSLNDVGTRFVHSNVDKIVFDDLYCPPDLRIIKMIEGANQLIEL